MQSPLRLAVAAMFALSPLLAGTITFTYAGDGTGNFNGTALTNAPFVLVFTGDTATEVETAYGFTLQVTGTIEVGGFSLATLTDVQTISYNPSVASPPYGQLSVNSESTGIFFSGGFNPADAPLANWNGTSPPGLLPFFPFGFGDDPSWRTN
jgi:hypothetical protein